MITHCNRQHAVALAALSVALCLTLPVGVGGVGALAGANQFYASQPARAEERATLAELVESLHDAARVLAGLSIALIEPTDAPRFHLADAPRRTDTTGRLTPDRSPPLRHADVNLPPPVLG